ncbi:MAG: hypothetical protein HQL82_07505 [Magnetococcales bacterium]|nr:hypothetical protein [Magnetococcales bacterium]
MNDIAGRVRELVFESIDDVNLGLDPDNRLTKDDSEPLFGPNSRLGSLGLVNLLLAVEERVEAGFGQPILITDNPTLFNSEGPLRSLGVFIDFVADMVRKSES